jgi:hypothetical protein
MPLLVSNPRPLIVTDCLSGSSPVVRDTVMRGWDGADDEAVGLGVADGRGRWVDVAEPPVPPVLAEPSRALESSDEPEPAVPDPGAPG